MGKQHLPVVSCEGQEHWHEGKAQHLKCKHMELHTLSAYTKDRSVVDPHVWGLEKVFPAPKHSIATFSCYLLTLLRDLICLLVSNQVLRIRNL